MSLQEQMDETRFLLKVNGILQNPNTSQLLDILALAREYDFQETANTTTEVFDFVNTLTGYFTLNDVYVALSARTKEEKSRIRKVIERLKQSDRIESAGKKAGQYRRVISDCEEVDWLNAPNECMDIKWPFELENLVEIYPSNIAIIAGDTNAGKTTFLLDFIRLNMDNHEVHYFNSEMGSSEFKLRLGLFESVELGEWNFTAWERSGDFQDVIKPNAINIIDFLEVTDEFWKVGSIIKDIHAKLKDGIAVIAIQKNRGSELGRGGSFGSEKPRLYLSMDWGRVRIYKAKNWKTRVNPNGMVQDFEILRGSEFIPEGSWHTPITTTEQLGRY